MREAFRYTSLPKLSVSGFKSQDRADLSVPLPPVICIIQEPLRRPQYIIHLALDYHYVTGLTSDYFLEELR
jgi:hypothetical protein